jgi:hypothetical protein
MHHVVRSQSIFRGWSYVIRGRIKHIRGSGTDLEYRPKKGAGAAQGKNLKAMGNPSMLKAIVADLRCPPCELLIPQAGGGVLCCEAARKLVRQELADKPKVKIKVKEFVNDVRQGMDDQSLIRKYSLSVTMLPKVLDQLVAAGHLNEQDLAARNIFDSTQKVAQLFSMPGDELE